MIVEELVDIATRHQVYLERLKAGEIKRSDVLFAALDTSLQTVLLKLRLSDLGLLTVVEGAALVEDIRHGQIEAYTEHLNRIIKMLRDLADGERQFELASLDEVTVDEVEPDDGDFALLLWPRVQQRPMSATGELLTSYLAAWAAHETGRAANLVRRAIAEGWSAQDMQSAFRGTQAQRYTDGLFASAKRNTATTINTAIQHVSSTTREGVMENTILQPANSGTAKRRARRDAGEPDEAPARNSTANVETGDDGTVKRIPKSARKAAKAAGIKIGDKLSLMGYRWISILDSLTSQICRSLDGQVFPFAKGPLPPAHPNCRSSIIAEMIGKWLKRDASGRFDKRDERAAQGAGGKEAVDGKVTYYEWLKTQPEAFQNDALGVTRATLFRKGGMSAAAFAKLNLGRHFEPLTLDEMRKLAPRAFKRAGI